MRFHFCKYFAHFFSQILLPQAFSCAKAGIEGVLLRKTSRSPAAGRHKFLLPRSSFDRTLCRFVGIQGFVRSLAARTLTGTQADVCTALQAGGQNRQ
jgi:hypothetical protein